MVTWPLLLITGLDNTAAGGAEGIQTLINIVDELEGTFGAEKEWSSNTRKKLIEYKRYLKTEYRQHCRAESSPCPDHCRPFALSDSTDKCFAANDCLHEHNQSCDSCEQLNEASEAIENKISELSSRMYSKEQREEMKYDFKQAKDNVYKWKAHIMRAENQEEGKQVVFNINPNRLYPNLAGGRGVNT